MSREAVFMRDLICQYHPEFVLSSEMRQCGLRRPELFNIEKLVEESLAFIGGYKFVDADHFDFDDYSDSKTASVSLFTQQCSVTGVDGKIGSLRISVYNPCTEGLDYFYVPKKDLEYVRTPCYGKQFYRQRIRFRWSKNGHYNWFEDFRLPDFVTLAQAMDD